MFSLVTFLSALKFIFDNDKILEAFYKILDFIK